MMYKYSNNCYVTIQSPKAISLIYSFLREKITNQLFLNSYQQFDGFWLQFIKYFSALSLNFH